MATPYDGTNSDLREPHCAKCGSMPERLLRCSRCGVVMYCGVDCQKDDFARHKKVCRDVQRADETLEQQAGELSNFSEWGEPPSNWFETQAGSFWGLIGTRDNMRQRISLISHLTILARETQTKDAWSLVADHIQECLRLNLSDNNGLRFAFPLVLLRVNRDDDAYCFCKYWITFNDWDDENQTHRFSKVGDWIYPKQTDCRYLDVFKDCEKLDAETGLWILVAFTVIKMRLVAVFESRKSGLAVNDASSAGEQVHEVAGNLELEHQLSDQGRQLDRLLDLIDARNKTMIPALLHPGPLMTLPSPPYYSHGDPSEARMMLPDVVDLWNSIPGASAYLAKRLGTTTPSYATGTTPSSATGEEAITL